MIRLINVTSNDCDNISLNVTDILIPLTTSLSSYMAKMAYMKYCICSNNWIHPRLFNAANATKYIPLYVLLQMSWVDSLWAENLSIVYYEVIICEIKEKFLISLWTEINLSNNCWSGE